jgi:hypothetical protein
MRAMSSGANHLSVDRYPGGPCPIPSGTPPGEQWAPMGVPPDNFEFMDAVPTRECWMMPCPVCGVGWCRVVPDGSPYGYRLAAELGCSIGCEAPEVAWWQPYRLGERPPREPPDERARAYASAVIRRRLAKLPARPSQLELRRTAFTAGQWIETGNLSAGPVERVLLGAASRSGLDPTSLALELADAILAGRARPGRLPR